jgi:hypothetical protein
MPFGSRLEVPAFRRDDAADVVCPGFSVRVIEVLVDVDSPVEVRRRPRPDAGLAGT